MPTPLPLQPSELELLKVRRMPMDEWAEANYVLTEMTASTPGPWSNDYTPFLVEPMRRLSAPGPAEVTVMACTQAAKTELGNIFLGYVIDQCPAPFMIVMPNRFTAKRRVNVRYRAMFEGCPRLKMRLPGGSVDNLNIGSETILQGMPLYLGYAGSPAALADVPVCYLHIDEPVLFPPVSGHEGEPTDVVEKRTRTFRLRRKILTTSSGGVVGDPLDTKHKSGTQAVWWGRCSRCGRYHQVSGRDNLKLAHNADGHLLGSEAYKDDKNSWYECPVCSFRMQENDRWEMISAGLWVPAGVRIDERGLQVGQGKRTNHYSYRIKAVMLHPRFETMAGVAEKWAKAMEAKKTGNIIKLRDFITKQEGESWEERGREVDEDKLAKKINKNLHKRCVPNACRLVVVGADYHEPEGQVRIDYTIKAFAPGLISSTSTAGSVDSFEALERELFEIPLVWVEDSDSPEPVVRTVFMDSGAFSDKVYAWCRKHKGRCYPTKGVQTQRIPLDIVKLDKVVERAVKRVRRGKAKQYTGMYLIHVDTSHFKDQVSSWCEAAIGDEGSTEFYAELPDWYLPELCAEHKVQENRGGNVKFVWKPKGGTPSHALDTEVLAAAAAHFNKAYAMGAGSGAPRAKSRVGRVERFKK